MVSGTEFMDGLVPRAHSSFPLLDVMIVLIDHAHQLFTYSIILLIPT